ncbi:FIST signal transduction protein [Desulfurobacterium crinifex]
MKDEDFTDFDFAMFAVSPKYRDSYITYTVEKILKIPPEKYIAFHAVDSFENSKIVNNGISALFIKFERKAKIKVLPVEGVYTRKDYEDVVEFLKERKDALNLIFAGFCNQKLAFVIEDKLSKALPEKGEKTFLIGGVSSGARTYQFYNGNIIKDGFLIVSIEGVDYKLGISLGFESVGEIYTVTRSKDYRVYEIDRSSAYQLVDRLLKGVNNYTVRDLWYFPVILLDDEEGYVSVVRTFKDISNKEFIEFFGPVKEGSKFKLSFGDPESLISADRKEASKIAYSMDKIELALNFSCIARQYVLENLQQEEIKIYSSLFNAPLFGFFTFGEIGPDKLFRKLKFYNQTSLIVAIRER